MKKYAADKNQHGTTITGNVAKGTIICVCAELLLAAALTTALRNEWIQESAIASCVFAITLVSVFVGSTSALAGMNNRYAIVAGSVGLACYALLIGGGILFSDKPFNSIVPGVLATVTGGALSCLTPAKRKQDRHRKRKHSR